MFKKILVLITPLLMLGCGANWNSIYRTFDVSKGESPMVDIRQRSILIAPRPVITETYGPDGKSTGKKADKGVFVCAEPSPDAMASAAYELAAKVSVADKASGEVALAMQDSAAFTGLRTQSIQLLRDFGYRLCESRMSGSITDSQYDLLMRRFQKNTVALLAIEQLTGTAKAPPIILTSSGRAEATKSLADQRNELDKIGDRLTELENEKKSNETKLVAATTDQEKTELKAIIDGLTAKKTQLQSDQKAIQNSIEQTKGVLADGKTEVTIKTEPTTGQKSDQYLIKVAETVGEIVNNIVLSDDEKQLCMSALQSDEGAATQSDFKAWCKKSLNNQADVTALRITDMQVKTKQAKDVLDSNSSTPEQKAEATKVIEAVSTDAKEMQKLNGTYIYGGRQYSK
jgi:hypothetical protein